MSDNDETGNGRDYSGATTVVRFPQSRVSPGEAESFKDLGTSSMSAKLGMPDRQMTGHWCSRCKGIWFGYLLEVECPQCGNRNG